MCVNRLKSAKDASIAVVDEYVGGGRGRSLDEAVLDMQDIRDEQEDGAIRWRQSPD
jgi:hypothetical protein